jgi:ribose-phosphate pyrophosphokinase
MNDNKHFTKHFITPEYFDKIKKIDLSGPNGWLLFVACNSAIDYAQKIKVEYENMLAEKKSKLKEIPIIGTAKKPNTAVFADTETCPRLNQSVSGADAFVFQCVHDNKTGNTVNENIQQLIQVVRTLRAHRAETITVITPYSPYSRQDKPSFMKREATLARLFADQLKVAGADVYVTYHPHSYSLYGFYEPETHFVALSGMDLFVDIFEDFRSMRDVVAVSTDAGGSKFTVKYSDLMDISYAISSKFRGEKDKTSHLGIVGKLRDKRVGIITDDETVTGSSILNAVKSLYNYKVDEIFVGISHFKVKEEYLPGFIEAHEKYHLKELHITDTIPFKSEMLDYDFIKIHSLARRFAAVVNSLHYNQSISRLSRYDLVNE